MSLLKLETPLKLKQRKTRNKHTKNRDFFCCFFYLRGTCLRLEHFVCERVLTELVELQELQAALAAGKGALGLMLQHVVLQLTTVGKCLTAVATLEAGWPLVADLMALEVGVGGELHGALRADVAATSLMLHLVGSQLAGVGKASATEAAAEGLDIGVLQHVAL